MMRLGRGPLACGMVMAVAVWCGPARGVGLYYTFNNASTTGSNAWDSVRAYDTATGAATGVDQEYTVNGYCGDLKAYEGKLYYTFNNASSTGANAWDSVRVYDVATGTTAGIDDEYTVNGYYGALDARGGRLFYTFNNSSSAGNTAWDSVYARDLATGTTTAIDQRQTVNGYFGPVRADAGKLFYAFNNSSSTGANAWDSLYSCDLATGAKTAIAERQTVNGFYGAIEAAGGKIFYTFNNSSSTGANAWDILYAYDLATGATTVIDDRQTVNGEFGALKAYGGKLFYVFNNSSSTGSNAWDTLYAYDLASGTQTVIDDEYTVNGSFGDVDAADGKLFYLFNNASSSGDNAWDFVRVYDLAAGAQPGIDGEYTVNGYFGNLTVPEPACLALLTAGVPAFLRRRRT